MLNISHVTRQQNIYAIDKDVDVRYYSGAYARCARGCKVQSLWWPRAKCSNQSNALALCHERVSEVTVLILVFSKGARGASEFGGLALVD